MTQEDKELLLKDLCVRIPYGVVCKTNDARKFGTLISVERSKGEMLVYIDHGRNEAEEFDINEGDIVKPYLRPMSSMTEEELTKLGELEAYKVLPSVRITMITDFLNEHHIDYRELIRMGLALEAPEGMYKTE